MRKGKEIDRDRERRIDKREMAREGERKENDKYTQRGKERR